MIDFTNYLTSPTSHGRLLQAPSPRAGLLALPAPTPPIAGFLGDGLPVIMMEESIPLILTMSDLENWLKKTTGYRNIEEIEAEYNAEIEKIKQHYYDQLLQRRARRVRRAS